MWAYARETRRRSGSVTSQLSVQTTRYFTLSLLSSRPSGCAIFFFFSSRRRHTRFDCDWSSRRVLFRSLEFNLILGNGNVYPQRGTFYALDRNLDPKTGAIRYEVTFPNPGNILRPGQFGKVRFVADMKKGALVVPQEAVNELQGNFQVAVVDQNN